MQVRPGYERRVPDLAPARLQAALRLLRGERSLQGELARRRIGALRRLDRELLECQARLRALVRQADTGLLAVRGVGVITAARILGEVRDVRRFHDRAPSPGPTARRRSPPPRARASTIA